MLSSTNDLGKKWVTSDVTSIPGEHQLGWHSKKTPSEISRCQVIGGSNTVPGSGRRLVASAFEIVEPDLYILL